MNQYFRNLKRSKLFKLLLLALIIRFILLPFSFHSDLNNNQIWGIYADEFGLRGFYDWLNFGNYARPDYPPLAMVLFLLIRILWRLSFDILWFVNVKITFFPSNLVTWFDNYGNLMLIKIPGLLADLGVGYLIFKITNKINLTKLFLFNPAIIYLSACWGQLDSVVSFLALLAIYFLLQKKYYNSLIYYFISIFVKATFVPLGIIILLQTIRQRVNLLRALGLVSVSTVLLWAIGYMFIDKNYLPWAISTYVYKILPGAVTLPYLNLNAFNFWGLVFGLERLSDSVLYFGFSLNNWAYIISFVFILFTLRKFWRGADIYFTLLILYFLIFMFFPRVHERYLYPVFVFFPLVLYKMPKLKGVYYVLSAVFLLNLYHWWWFPNIPILVNLLDLEIIERLLSLINLGMFTILFRKYLSIHEKS